MGLFKRGTVWWMRFSYRGRQFRRSTETPDKRLAEKIHHKVMTQIAEGKWLDIDPAGDTTFRELIEKYLREHSPKKAEGGVKRDRSSCKHLLLYFGDYLLADITPRLISEYKGLRYSKGAMPATINRELALMKHAFTLATREWDLSRDNPVKRVSMEREDNARDRWLDYDEEDRLLAACPEWLGEIVTFAVNTGMRLEEILSLEWKNVSLFRRTATVVKSKNREKRTIPLNEPILKLLKARSKVRHLASGYVFTSLSGTKIDQGNLRRVFIPARKKAGLEDLRFHDLRHTFATRLVQSGIDLYKVQKLLGHKTPAMTQRYAHHYPESLRDTVDILGQARAEISTILAQSTKKGLRENP
jgi:integrase